MAYVFDGDTFRTRGGERIRLLGINTPEVGHDKQPEQPYAKQAKLRLIQLIMGKSVQLRLDKEKRDKYGRTLAHIYLRDGRWINNIMVAEGLAQVYTFAPNFSRTVELLQSESEAIHDVRGLWKSSRFRVLDASGISSSHIGTFRLVRGYVKDVQKWRFKTGKLTISVPRKFRQWFTPADLPHHGQKVLFRGVIRTSTSNRLYLAIHSPYDIEYTR
ncbi:MAG: thermonuclease family protein [Mariprofundus sp.]|nr:thermonuclease family protein [Mariprofundus sp.]